MYAALSPQVFEDGIKSTLIIVALSKVDHLSQDLSCSVTIPDPKLIASEAVRCMSSDQPIRPRRRRWRRSNHVEEADITATNISRTLPRECWPPSDTLRARFNLVKCAPLPPLRRPCLSLTDILIQPYSLRDSHRPTRTICAARAMIATQCVMALLPRLCIIYMCDRPPAVLRCLG